MPVVLDIEASESIHYSVFHPRLSHTYGYWMDGKITLSVHSGSIPMSVVVPVSAPGVSQKLYFLQCIIHILQQLLAFYTSSARIFLLDN